jgi:hypothetical protein
VRADQIVQLVHAAGAGAQDESPAPAGLDQAPDLAAQVEHVLLFARAILRLQAVGSVEQRLVGVVKGTIYHTLDRVLAWRTRLPAEVAKVTGRGERGAGADHPLDRLEQRLAQEVCHL